MVSARHWAVGFFGFILFSTFLSLNLTTPAKAVAQNDGCAYAYTDKGHSAIKRTCPDSTLSATSAKGKYVDKDTVHYAITTKGPTPSGECKGLAVVDNTNWSAGIFGNGVGIKIESPFGGGIRCGELGGTFTIKPSAVVGGELVGFGEGDDECTEGEEGCEETTSCNIDGIGWIICPALYFMGKMNDAAFGIINNFLEVQVGLLEDSQTKYAWEQFRNIANVLFVVAFLIIIYSQITGAGVTNYGIKRLLPKLIIAAILVNISYYVCQIAVDLSNIIGNGVYGFFKDIPTDPDGDGNFSGSFDLGWENVIVGVLAAAAFAAALIFLAMSLGAAALLAFIMVVVILLARKAIIILLIVVSPLAFVAYLLPNTEQWFKKWWSLLSKLLMVYPIIGVIFGASYLAARIVNNAAGSACDAGIASCDDQTLLQLTALGVMAVPLFAIPGALKGAMAATGALGAKLSGGLDRATGGMNKMGKDRMKRHAESWEARAAANERQTRLGRAGRFVGGFRGRRESGRKSMESETARDQEDALARHVLATADANTPEGRRKIASAQLVQAKRRKEELEAARATMRGLTREQHMALAQGASIRTDDGRELHGDDAATREAAIGMVGPSLDSREALSLAESVAGADLSVRQAAVEAVGGKTPLTSGSQLGAVESGSFTRSGAITSKINAGDISAEWLATKAKPADIKEIAIHIESVADPAEKQQLQGIIDGAVAKIASSPELSTKVVAGTERDTALRQLSSAQGRGGARNPAGGTTLISGDEHGLR